MASVKRTTQKGSILITLLSGCTVCFVLATIVASSTCLLTEFARYRIISYSNFFKAKGLLTYGIAIADAYKESIFANKDPEWQYKLIVPTWPLSGESTHKGEISFFKRSDLILVRVALIDKKTSKQVALYEQSIS